jgi:hypothetical protein
VEVLMMILEVLDPTVGFDSQTGSDLVAETKARDLRGARVGFRLDTLWRSWDWVSDEWARQLEAAGASVSTWRAGTRTGAEGEATAGELDAFVEGIDLAIVGMGNCGSCTQWTIKDAITAANAGVPTVAIVTDQFKDIAQVFARLGGRPDLQFTVLPYPLDTLPEEEVRKIADDNLASALQALGVR